MRNAGVLLGSFCAACGPVVPGGDTPATEVAMTDAADTTAAEPTSGPAETTALPTTGEPDPTTGEPPKTCPEDQPSRSLQWDHTFPGGDEQPRLGGVVVAPDGRVFVGQTVLDFDVTRVGLQFVSPLGDLAEQVLLTTPTHHVLSRLALIGGRPVLFGARRRSGSAG